MFLLLLAEAEAAKDGDVVREAELRAEYLLLCDGYYDYLFE